MDNFNFNPGLFQNPPAVPPPVSQVTFGPGTTNPANAYSQSTTVPNPGVNAAGYPHPGKPNPTAKDWRGLGITNPWGGGKMKYRKTINKRRKSRRKSMRRKTRK